MRISVSKMDKEGAPSIAGGGAVLAPQEPKDDKLPAPDEASDVKWDSLADDLDEVEDDELPEADPTGTPAGEAPAPVATPPATPATPAAPAGAPPAAPAAATPPATPAPTTPVTPAPTQEEIAQQQQQARDNIRNSLRDMYATGLTDDDKAALITSPDTVIPQMMAQAALDGAQLAMAHMAQALPQMLDSHIQRGRGADQAWSEFYSANADLNKPEYRPAIEASLRAVKAMGLKLSKEEAIAKVGQFTRDILKLPAQGTGSPPVSTPAASVQTAAPVAPFTPVARGRAAPAPSKPAQKSGWDQFLTDDED